MNIFNFFRIKQNAPTAQIIKFNDVGSFILNEKIKINRLESNSIAIVKKNLNFLCSQLEGEIEIINNLDLKERKIEDKVRLIVLDNAKTFANYVKRLKESLANLNAEKLDSLILQINESLSDFKKKSYISHEKARYLIGDELQAVINSINEFYENTSPTIKENESIIHNSKILDKIEDINSEIKTTKQIENKLDEEISRLEKNKINFQKEIELLQNKISHTGASKEYEEYLRKKQALEIEQHEIKRALLNLKDLLGLKQMAKIHHSSSKNMQIIKEYTENIESAFEKDKGESILRIVIENKKEILEKIDYILKKEEHLASITLPLDQTAEYKKEINAVESRFAEIHGEKIKLEKRKNQSSSDLIKLRGYIDKELENINIKLE